MGHAKRKQVEREHRLMQHDRPDSHIKPVVVEPFETRQLRKTQERVAAKVELHAPDWKLDFKPEKSSSEHTAEMQRRRDAGLTTSQD